MGKSVILVGCGNMGYAMLKGWIASGELAPADVSVVEPNEALRARAQELGVTTVEDASDLSSGNLIIFAVKPQVMGKIVPSYARFEDATFVSVAAGTGIATFTEILGPSSAVIRCMPNTPAAIGKGMMVVFANENVEPAMLDFVKALLATSGEVTMIESEEQMDAVTAVSGSGPAYIFHFIECLTSAGEKAGLPGETAKLLAMQTVWGAACLAKESGEEPGLLREQVTSPNGTTAAALSVFMDQQKLEELVGEAVAAAKKRSIELGQ